MVCHKVEVETDQNYREDNDNQFDIDEESQLLNSIKTYWLPQHVDNLTPNFYLYEQIKTHDLSTGPYVVVYYNGESHSPLGIGYPANTIHMDMTIEIRTLTRSQLFKMKEHVFEIINYIRKRPFMDYDLILNNGGRRLEANPGNFAYSFDLSLVQFVKRIDSTRWE